MQSFLKSTKNWPLSLITVSTLLLTACGGSSGGGTTPSNLQNVTNEPSVSWIRGEFQPSDDFIGQCESPRIGIDPATGVAYPDQQGDTLDENNWLRSWSNETYLWYDEIIDRDPSLYATAEYFDLLKTNATTPSGNPKDQFHFTVDTEEWLQFSQSGASSSFGIRWAVIRPTSPRDIRITYIEPGSPAENAGLTRGLILSEVNNVNIINTNTQSGVDMLNEALFSPTEDSTYTFKFQDLTQTFALTAQVLEIDPVPISKVIPTTSGDVGYLLFNDHNAVAEERLVESISTLAQNNISDLILDLRYNSGGFLAIGSQLAYMIAGSQATTNKIFETLTFNDKHPSIDPVTGQPITPFPFINTTVGLSSLPSNQPLPQLNLDRVYILSTEETCSASESIINGLRGIDVEVILIGSTTCGKPYGFYGTDNCGTTYFTIQFQGINNKGFGDFADGFSPINTSGSVGALVQGCSVADDLSEALGNTSEGLLQAALNYRTTSTCPLPSGQSLKYASSNNYKMTDVNLSVQAPKYISNKILTHNN